MQRTNTNGERRYPKNKFPAYHETYTQLKDQSPILTGSSNDLNDMDGCKLALIELQGSRNEQNKGYYKRGGDWRRALIPSAKQTLQEVLKKFRHWQSEQVRSGKALKPPTEWPDHLLNERLRAEAVLDVRHLEKVIVEQRLEELQEIEDEKRNRLKPVLPHGPLGDGLHQFEMSNVPIDRILVDGQRVSKTPEGVPFIDEESSPYHRMTVVDYREMSKAWRDEHRLGRHDLIRRKNQHVEKLREAGEDVRISSLENFIEVLQFAGRWPDNPEWPSGAEPVDEIEAVAD